jgi:hypothetical protein
MKNSRRWAAIEWRGVEKPVHWFDWFNWFNWLKVCRVLSKLKRRVGDSGQNRFDWFNWFHWFDWLFELRVADLRWLPKLFTTDYGQRTTDNGPFYYLGIFPCFEP